MIHVINNINDPLISVVKDDPVRPELSEKFRIEDNKEILVLIEDDTPSAAVCISYQDFVPKRVEELKGDSNSSIAIFYTIWSYKKEAGKRLLFAAKDYIKENKKTVKRFITLSPQTEMARNFHIGNGAFELSYNKESVNYEYP